jgi:hypothetical protein
MDKGVVFFFILKLHNVRVQVHTSQRSGLVGWSRRSRSRSKGLKRDASCRVRHGILYIYMLWLVFQETSCQCSNSEVYVASKLGNIEMNSRRVIVVMMFSSLAMLTKAGFSHLIVEHLFAFVPLHYCFNVL